MEQIIEQVLNAIKGDKDKVKEFLADPKAMLEKLNINFNPDQLKDIVTAVKGKVKLESLEEKGEELLKDVTGFFHKK